MFELMSRRIGILAIATMLAFLSACGGSKPFMRRESGPVAAATIVSPKAGATDVPAGIEIQFTVERATSVQVALVDAAGASIAGNLRSDGTTWLPDKALKYATKYSATVTATGDDGKPATATSAFTTMARPANQVRVSSVVGDDMVVGIGMPMIVQFGRDVPKDVRAAVQQRLTVQSTPPQEGAWRWYNAREVHYRPKEFWQSGTKLNMTVRTGGLPMGDGWYGRNDLTVSASIGPALTMQVDNATKQMTVTENGVVTKTIPVSLGRPSMPSSSGTMIVMEKLAKTVFDTTRDPNPANRYRTDIEFAQRITWSGQFIHAAPWSVDDQGERNVSHGCINMSTENAQWLFGKTRIGDPVTVKGTEEQVQFGNGWTDWSMPWAEYSKG